MQYRSPVSVGPSSNTCPRWELHLAHRISVRTIPWVSSVSRFIAPGRDLSKLGHPVPESNFASEENSALPHAAQRNIPSSLEYTYLPVKGISVPFSRKILYWSEDSFSFQSS